MESGKATASTPRNGVRIICSPLFRTHIPPNQPTPTSRFVTYGKISTAHLPSELVATSPTRWTVLQNPYRSSTITSPPHWGEIISPNYIRQLQTSLPCSVRVIVQRRRKTRGGEITLCRCRPSKIGHGQDHSG